MKYLYVDNFRGFSNTFIPIKDVNFLVGENSTGKTSILALVYLISKPSFWFEQSFNRSDVHLGTYYDILSEGTNKKEMFRIGFLDDKFKDNKPFAFLLEFIEKDYNPIAIKYDTYFNGLELNIQFVQKRIRYQSTLYGIRRGDKNLRRIFNKWIKTKDRQEELKSLKYGVPYADKGILFYIHSMILLELKDLENQGEYDFRNYIPDIFKDCTWISPVRTKPKRTYDELHVDESATGEHIPYMIRKILRNEKESFKFKKFMSIFGKESALFEALDIKEYGKQLTAPFELKFWLGKRHLNITNVGYGVSQSLPVLVELFSKPENCWFAIQQQEIHLHPKAQAAFGDIIYDLALKENKKFLIETHSDYTIDRFRYNINKSKKEVSSQVLFFERTPTKNKVHPISIGKSGEYPDRQPEEFRSFFVKEQLDILGI